MRARLGLAGQNRRSGVALDSGRAKGVASYASASSDPVGSAIQPSRLAAGRSSGSGRRVRPRAAARAVSAAITASRAPYVRETGASSDL